MIWFLIPAVAVAAKVVYDYATDDSSSSNRPNKSSLELNLERLQRELNTHQNVKKIAIVGQPGAGKSSLLKKMTKGKVKPLPVIGTQTDATSWADELDCNLLSHYENYIFVDVPGYDTTSHPKQTFLSSFPFYKFDAFIFVIHGKLHGADEEIFKSIHLSGKRFCVARSHCDSLEDYEKTIVKSDLRGRLNLNNSTSVSLFSNRTGEGIDEIFKFVS
jgi:GTP-binding protein EngB required for normal cell division